MRRGLRAALFLVAAAWLSPGVFGCAGGGKAAETGGGATGDLGVAGLDTSSLTVRERSDWSAFVSELKAPCPEQNQTLKQCVKEGGHCRACMPAVKFLFSQVRRGKSPAQVQAAYRIRFAPEQVKRIPLGDSAAKGAANPTVTIVEWADFECPACALNAPLLDRKVKAYPEHVRLVFKHFPLASHKSAEPAARAAVAAGKQGRFWRVHDLMYINQHLLNEKGLLKLATQAGLELQRFEEDRSSKATQKIIDRERRQGDALGLTGTPMIYINGRYFDFDHFSVLDDLDEWIELELELVTGQRVTPREITSTTWPDPEPDSSAAAESSGPPAETPAPTAAPPASSGAAPAAAFPPSPPGTGGNE